MPTVYLALGTNLGDRPANLRAKVTVTYQVTGTLFRIAVLFLVDVVDSYTCAGVY
jgi:7,8-dihydro-6-hydroxymethylpterin-pyrophosphokinase